MDLKQKLSDLKKSTKIAVVGSAIVVAGSWGSCQLDLSEETETVEPEMVEPEAVEPNEAPDPA